MLPDLAGCRKLRDRDLVVEAYHGEALGARDLAWIRKQRTVTKSDGTPLKGNRPRVEVVFGVTSLRPLNARPARILKIVRAHWGAI